MRTLLFAQWPLLLAALAIAGCRHHKTDDAEPRPTTAELSQTMQSTDKDDQYEAVKAISGLPVKDKAAIELLISALDDKDPDVRWKATEGLAKGGAAAEVAVPKLIERLHDRDATVRAGAAHALGTMKLAGLRRLSDLQAAALNDPSEDVRREADRSVLTLRFVQKQMSKSSNSKSP